MYPHLWKTPICWSSAHHCTKPLPQRPATWLKFTAVLHALVCWSGKTTKLPHIKHTLHTRCLQKLAKRPQKSATKVNALANRWFWHQAAISCWITSNSNKKQKLPCCTCKQGCYSFHLYPFIKWHTCDLRVPTSFFLFFLPPGIRKCQDTQAQLLKTKMWSQTQGVTVKILQ